jgi:hypothetical protein
MFVRDFIEIHQPFEAIAPRLVRDAAWLDPIAHDALEEAIAVIGALHPDEAVRLGVPPLTVQCVRGAVRLRADALVMPLRWDTNLPAFWPPSLDGDLEVVPLGETRTQVALNANTCPSPRDRDAITRRVVETSLRSFLRQLAANLNRTS